MFVLVTFNSSKLAVNFHNTDCVLHTTASHPGLPMFFNIPCKKNMERPAIGTRLAHQIEKILQYCNM